MGFFRQWKHALESNVEQLERGERINIDPLLLDQYPDAVYVLDCDLRLVDSNEKLSLLFNGEEERFIHPASWLPKAESERVQAFHQRSLQGETVHYELQARNADGRSIHLSITNTPLYTGRVITGLYGVVKDLTTQTELRERYNRMKVSRVLFERIPGLILIELDLDTGTFCHSPQTGNLLGLTKRQLANMKREDFRNLIHEDDRGAFAAALEAGTLTPIEEYVETIPSSSRLIHAGITITRLRDQDVAVGTSPIVIMRRGFKTIAFYASIRLPVDSDLSLVILLDDGMAPLPIQVTRLTELANGLYQYEASYEQTVELEKRLTALESEKPRGFTIQKAKDLIDQTD